MRYLIDNDVTPCGWHEVDIEYYVSKQVVPAGFRILSMFGMAEDELLPSKTPKTLLEFMES